MGKASDEIIGLYRRHAAAFARGRGQDLHEKPWLDRFLALMEEPRSVLDMGCGAGQPIARYLRAAGCEVTGIDTAPELLDLARADAPEAHWICADMRDLDLGARFGGVLAWNSFFHLTPEDQRRMFAVFRAHAAPGAALMFTSGTEHGATLGEFQGETLYHASLDPTEFRDLLDAHGFDLVDHVAEDPECGHHTVWLARARAHF